MKAIQYFDFTKSPLWLKEAIKNATFIGGGASSKVWNLNNGYVLKLTKDKNVIQFLKDLKVNPILGLPDIFYIRDKIVRHKKTGQLWCAIIQPLYKELSNRKWTHIKKALNSANPSFNRDQDGYNTSGRIACYDIKKLKSSQSLKNLDITLDYLHRKLYVNTHLSLDIDHIDNWCQNGQQILILDPIV